jgi:archaellum component FlaC
MEERMNHLEDRIRREIRQEKSAREAGDAESDEEIESLDERVATVETEQERTRQRLSWIEKRLGPAGRPPKRPKN